MRNILRKLFYFKIKEINLKTTKMGHKIPNKPKENKMTK